MKQGYTGDFYIIIDDEDKTASEYKKRFGADRVITFCKQEYLDKADTGDITGTRGVILPARNACFDIARKLGLTYFLELDDDYIGFYHRFADGPKLGQKKIDCDAVFDAYLDFLDESGALSVCMSQGGDLIGGVEAFSRIRWKRKAMNSFFCRTDRPFSFMGRINEDVNTYTTLAHRGELLCTVGDVSLVQMQTQQNKGGMSESYLELGTYMKSFYSVMFCPSAVKVSVMGQSGLRLHHEVDWERCAPKIISERHRKTVRG